jgi:hypothetical protein
MAEECIATERPTKDDIKTMLSSLLPELGTHWTVPLRDYAASVYDAAPLRSTSPIREDACQRVKRLVEGCATRAGCSLSDALEAGKQIVTNRVLQTGPHCHLLVEPDAFYTLLFSVMGLQAQRLPCYIWYSASTVKFIESAKKGPGWLRLENEAINLFGLPRKQMERRSICAMEDNVRFALQKQAGRSPWPALQELASLLPKSDFTSAAEAIRAANLALSKVMLPNAIKLIQFDDVDVADLVADHLGDPNSWMAINLFGRPSFAQALLGALDAFESGPWTGWIRRTTDLFWRLFNGRLCPLRLNGSHFVSPIIADWRLPAEAEAIAAALRAGQIIPNLLMTFFVISILPGLRVLGGCRQIAYYPLMREVVEAALSACGHVGLQLNLSRETRTSVWGHRVLKPAPACAVTEFDGGSIAAMLDRFGQQPLEQACGDLRSFTADPLWTGLAGRLANGSPAAATGPV